MSEIEELGFDINTQKRAKEYGLHKRKLSLVISTISFIAIIMILEFGITTALKAYVLQYTSDEWMVIALFMLIAYLAIWMIMLPLSFYEGFILEHRYDLSTQTMKSWVSDQLKGFALSLVLILGVIEVIYYLLREFPDVWWVIASVFMTVFSIIMAYVAPVLLMPIFFKFEPIEDDELRRRLLNLTEKADVNAVDVFRMKAGVKTKRAVGALAGIGNTRRVILSDTLLENYSSDEIEGVIGHEIGHHVYKHIGKRIVEGAMFMFLGLFLTGQLLIRTIGYFGFTEISDIAALPLFGLILGLFFMVLSPIENTISRRAEGHADQYELDLVKKPDAFISSMIKLCDQNLRDADPHPLIEFLFYDHPSGVKRVKRAIRFKGDTP
ncbi:MAG: M48 family metallopeptidase [Halobacteriota archaeon]|nr:M48 family metallopeptidase [Halobacteriota archaeon]